MYIYVMRHGEAANTAKSDALRPLTDAGLAQSSKSAKWIRSHAARLSCDIDCALVSPYLRAQQTFTQANRLLGIKRIENSDDIVPSGNVVLAHDYLRVLAQQCADLKSILVVSHMPFVSYFFDELCGDHQSRIFATASVVCIQYHLEQQKGVLIDEFSP